jgi:aryl-alcohol dehydrogenase-like predicted oxidoreductase
MVSRRVVIGGLAAGVAAAAGGAFVRTAVNRNMNSWNIEAGAPNTAHASSDNMNYRNLGKSGLKVSEVGFGAWGIGGNAYGTVERAESLRALARAEELGCNFIDTAMVYGDSEPLIGEFLKGRRSKWLVSTKYSGQKPGLEATLEEQLRRLGTDAVDLYMVHWVPSPRDHEIYEALHRVKKAGKARLVGFSLYTISDIRHVLKHTEADAMMVAFSLLDPDPFLAKLDAIRRSGIGVIIRSSLKEGFLTGKFKRDVTFPDPTDLRHSWSAEKIAATVDAAENFRFLEQEVGSMVLGAACYPLCFDATSTVVMGTKSEKHADTNFGVVPGTRLSAAALERIQSQQRSMGLFDRRGRLKDALAGLFS